MIKQQKAKPLSEKLNGEVVPVEGRKEETANTVLGLKHYKGTPS